MTALKTSDLGFKCLTSSLQITEGSLSATGGIHCTKEIETNLRILLLRRPEQGSQSVHFSAQFTQFLIRHEIGHYLGCPRRTCTLSGVSETPADLVASLQAENAALTARITQASAQIEELRALSVARQAEIRALAAQLPERMSRRAVITEMLRELRTTLSMRRRSPRT
jgi:hypothetical protein